MRAISFVTRQRLIAVITLLSAASQSLNGDSSLISTQVGRNFWTFLLSFFFNFKKREQNSGSLKLLESTRFPVMFDQSSFVRHLSSEIVCGMTNTITQGKHP